MPAYTGPGFALPLFQNRQAILFQNETVVAGTPSVAVQLLHSKGRGIDGRTSVSVLFSADPGAYVINVEGADDDQNVFYVPINGLGPGSSTTTTTFASRVDLQNPGVRYLRVRPVTLPNAVTMTVLVSRT